MTLRSFRPVRLIPCSPRIFIHVRPSSSSILPKAGIVTLTDYRTSSASAVKKEPNPRASLARDRSFVLSFFCRNLDPIESSFRGNALDKTLPGRRRSRKNGVAGSREEGTFAEGISIRKCKLLSAGTFANERPMHAHFDNSAHSLQRTVVSRFPRRCRTMGRPTRQINRG
jgi:hypothetical protein